MIILNNWLVNTTGFADSFIPVDLLQEHMNLWIKVRLACYIVKPYLDNIPLQRLSTVPTAAMAPGNGSPKFRHALTFFGNSQRT